MFTKIDALLWKDAKFTALDSDEKVLFIYLITCSHRNMLGCYYLPKMYVSGDLDWSVKRVSEGLDKLLRKGFATYDFDNQVVFVKNFLRYNPLENQNQVKGAIKVSSTLPKSTVMSGLIDVIKEFNNPIYESLIKGLEKGLQRVTEQVEVEVEVEVKEEVLKHSRVNSTTHVQEIVDYMNERLGSKYKSTTPKTITSINARMKEGFTVQDFKTVIDKKHYDWNNTDLSKFLRPDTLFGTKFESYLNQPLVVNGVEVPDYMQTKNEGGKGYEKVE